MSANYVAWNSLGFLKILSMLKTQTQSTFAKHSIYKFVNILFISF